MKTNFILVLAFFSMAVVFMACNTGTEPKSADAGKSSNITLPYIPLYPTEFTTNVSDADLLLVLNSYKYWETGDIAALRSTMGDSMSVNGANGFVFNGLADSLMNTWTKSRDSLSSVSITMATWIKIHSVKDSSDYINAWYKEIDTYKTGRVDSANYSDVNAVKNGKITWYTSYRQQLK